MTWIVTNGKEGKDLKYVQIREGGFWWTPCRRNAVQLADQTSAVEVAHGMTEKAFPVAVIDQLLNVEA